METRFLCHNWILEIRTIGDSKLDYITAYNTLLTKIILYLHSFKEYSTIPEACLVLLVLSIVVILPVMILDGGSDDVQIQREPAQTDDRDEEDIKCREILDQSQARKIRPEKLSKTKLVIVTGAMIKKYQQKAQTDGVSYGPEN